MNNCGTCFEFKYFWIATFGTVPIVPIFGQYADVFNELARLLDRLGSTIGVVELGEIDLPAVHPRLSR